MRVFCYSHRFLHECFSDFLIQTMSLSTDRHDVTKDLLGATAHGDRPPDLLEVHPQVSSETPPPSQFSGLESSSAHDDRPPDLINDWLQESSSTLPPSQLSSLKSSPAVLGLQIFTCGQSSDFSRYRF